MINWNQVVFGHVSYQLPVTSYRLPVFHMLENRNQFYTDNWKLVTGLLETGNKTNTNETTIQPDTTATGTHIAGAGYHLYFSKAEYFFGYCQLV